MSNAGVSGARQKNNGNTIQQTVMLKKLMNLLWKDLQ